MDVDIPVEDTVVEFAELNVPDITSRDPEERKLARRIRIQKRVEALQRQQIAEGEEALEEKQPEKPTLLQIQLEKSNAALKQLFLEGEELVTNVRVANDSREFDRRETDKLNREAVLQKIEEEATLAGQMFEEISTKWIDVLKYNDPLNIHDEILAQKLKCDELIRQKDAIIAMLRNEVKDAEIKFYKDQKLMNDDITMLAKRVEKQVVTMRMAHRVELQNIEDVMIQERVNLMENNDKRWEDLYKKREEQELAIIENKLRQKTEFEDVVTKVRIKHYERIREVKIRLERECENLQKEYEILKATALANREEIDYNYQILKKREDENLIIMSNQKRKINKLRDIINELHKKTENYRNQTEAAISKLHKEVKYLQKSITAVRNKSATLTTINERRYMDVWDLNYKEALGIMNKILKIDKLLHEHQMGLEWIEPTVPLLKKETLPSYIRAAKLLDSLQDKLGKVVSEEASATNTYTFNQRKILLNILQGISERSSYLIEYGLRSMLPFLKQEEAELVKIDHVFAGLGVQDINDIKILFNFFKPYLRCVTCSTNARNALDDATPSSASVEESSTDLFSTGSSELEETMLPNVHEPDQILSQIVQSLVKPERMPISQEFELVYGQKTEDKDIVEHKKSKKEKGQAKDPHDVTYPMLSKLCTENHTIVIEPGLVIKAVMEFSAAVYCMSNNQKNVRNVVDGKYISISRLLQADDVTNYWNRFKSVLGPKKIELWDSLLYAMKKYHEILQDRHHLHDSLLCARRQNIELKHLLSRYRQESNLKPPCTQNYVLPLKSDCSRSPNEQSKEVAFKSLKAIPREN